MSKENLAAKLERLAAFTTPPVEVLAEALAAYAARVADLEAEVKHERERVGKEVAFQYSIREQERQTRAEERERHQEEKRLLVHELGKAAVTHSRVLAAERSGRKTIRVEELLKETP